jgi:hypothetical protein
MANKLMDIPPRNQKEAILHYMLKTGPIDFRVAAEVCGVSQLTARINELRREGWEFSKTSRKGKNRYGNPFTSVIYSNPRRV